MENVLPREKTRHTDYRILVADDNAINCQIAKRLLEKLGCCVEIATTGYQVISLHAEHPCDLILMDCQMPDLDGYKAAAYLRAAEDATSHTPIIGWTANVHEEEKEKCRAAGMDDCIGKHLSLDELQYMLARWLERRAAPSASKGYPSDTASLEAMHRFAGKGFAELVELFEKDMPRRIGELQQAIVQARYSDASRIAHTMSGCCASIGAIHLSRLCQEVEIQAKACKADGMEDKLSLIHASYAHVRHTLHVMLNPSIAD